jgi:hypothetical protein
VIHEKVAKASETSQNFESSRLSTIDWRFTADVGVLSMKVIVQCLDVSSSVSGRALKKV